MGKSNYLEDKLLNWALKNTAMGTPPATVYVGLHNGDPTDAGTGGTEVTTTIRTAGRVAATFGTITTNAGANTAANSAIVDFGAAAGAVATMTHFGIWDAASGGNLLYADPLTGQPISVALGNLVSFPIGTLVVSEN